MLGFLVFAGMFALLAIRPRSTPGVWELAFGHKAAMAVAAVILAGAHEATSAGPIDAFLALAILTSYLCMRGWESWYAWRV
jgi:hypothetical protein